MVGFWNYFKFLFKEIPLTLPIVILFVSPLLFFGRKQLQFQRIALIEMFWGNRKLWGIVDILIALLAFSLAFAMGEMGPKRAWFPLNVAVFMVCCVFAYQFGTWAYIRLKGKLFIVVVCAQVLLIGFQVWRGIGQVQSTSAYAEAYGQRMQLIQEQLSTSECPMELEPLPNSGWLFSAEITSDTTDFRNRHLKLYFGDSCQFILSEKVISSAE